MLKPHIADLSFLLLCLLALFVNTSIFATNLCWVLLLVLWLLGGDWRRRLSRLKHSSLLQLFVAYYLLCMVGVLWSHDVGGALEVLRIRLPLLALPLVLLTMPPLADGRRRTLFLCYMASVLFVSLCVVARYLRYPDMPYRQLVPWVSNIRYSLSCALVVCLVACSLVGRRGPVVLGLTSPATRSPWRWLIYILYTLVPLWLLLVLLLLQSYTALAALCAVISLWLLRYVVASRRPLRIAAVALLYAAALTLLALYVRSMVADYYRPVAIEQQPLAPATAAGSPYSHNGGVVECGAHVGNYVCADELRRAWPLVSDMPIDSLTPYGYPVMGTLVRYLNSMGLAKDSAAVRRLSPSDVAAIEHGVANRVYTQPNRLRTMAYKMLFEYENYKLYGTVCNSSFGTRMVLWQAGLRLFAQHPLFGVGTGDVRPQVCLMLQESHPEVAASGKDIHSQYLALLVAFGAVGFAIVVVFALRALLRCVGSGRYRCQAYELLAFVAIVLVSFLTENTLGTLPGIMLVVLPVAMFRT